MYAISMLAAGRDKVTSLLASGGACKALARAMKSFAVGNEKIASSCYRVIHAMSIKQDYLRDLGAAGVCPTLCLSIASHHR